MDPFNLTDYYAKTNVVRLDGGKFDLSNTRSRLVYYTGFESENKRMLVRITKVGRLWRCTDALGEFYIAGPMRGYPMFNFPAFLMAARVLQTRGIKTCSPAEKDIESGFDPSRPIEDQNFDMGAAFRWDFNAVTRCTGIILLPGWENSTGAKAERLVCQLSQRECYYLDANYNLVEAPDYDYTLTWQPKPAPVEARPAPAVECDGDDDEE